MINNLRLLTGRSLRTPSEPSLPKRANQHPAPWITPLQVNALAMDFGGLPVKPPANLQNPLQ
eukprot:3281435-Prymnesium_polylepis.1